MLKKRLIPKLQMMPSSFNPEQMVLVITVGFDKTLEIGDPVSQAKIYEAQAADELIFIDIRAGKQGIERLAKVARTAAEEIFMPFTLGGGIRTLEDIRVLLSNGADKVSINTVAVDNPEFITNSARMFGDQCVVLSIDTKTNSAGKYEVWTRGGTVNTGLDPVEWAIQGQNLGAGEILITSISRDGSRKGLDIELTKNISDAVSIPVITSGGCGLAQHFIDGFIAGNASAVSAGTYFCMKDENPMQTRSQIKNAGIPIRILT
ncbi:cyclase [Maridesulfovibrio ferrireducens]|uniref:imidazole glycerol-phosphate synthase n=1 Tax=Maridesulfovibrio ferrireducens TaxID=246191 RepID=A0A1G9CP31_9BACT|nr:imidazole glycerol phosphate synthase cyclase subunit [Maridesulfovibrio ferrireducens]SDK53451.1 cyclase [Maridesulfovibrio ferrireducens]